MTNTREIKFRAWLKNKKEMNPFLTHTSETHPKILLSAPNDSDYELMQYTGLLDKHGKEIYEGDIVKVLSPEVKQDVMCVTWSNGGFYYTSDAEGSGWNITVDPYTQAEQLVIEIIGNIYKNLDLLTPNT